MFGWLSRRKRKPTGPEPERAPQAAPSVRPAPTPEAVGGPPPQGAAQGRTADDVLRELEGTQLEAAEETIEGPLDPTLGRHLLAEGPVTREFIHQQIAVSGKGDSYLGRVLARVRAPSEERLLRLLAAGYQMPQVDLKQCKIPIAVARSVPMDILRKYKMLPIDQVGDLLCVAFAGEANPKATEAVRRATGLRVKALRCPPHHIEILLRRLVYEAPPAQVKPARVVAAALISEGEFQEAMRGPEARWEEIHVTRGPLRALRIA